MNVSIAGVLFVWAGMLFYTLWPVLLVSIFLYIKRQKINKKWLFALAGIGVCYGISFVIAIATEPVLRRSAETVTEGENPHLFLLTINVIKIAQISISIFLINLLSKKYGVYKRIDF